MAETPCSGGKARGKGRNIDTLKWMKEQMANFCPSANSQGWNHDPHDKCLGTPSTEGRSAKRAAEEGHPALTTSGQVLVWSGSPREHLLQAPSSQLWNMQSIWQQYPFYRTEDLVWQLLYFELYRTLLSRDRRQSTPASSLQTYLTTGICLSALLFQARRPSEHTFHFKHMNCSTHNDKELTVPLTDVLRIWKVHLKRIFLS